MPLSATARAEIAAAFAATRHGERTALAARLAAMYDVSPSTIYRAADRRATPRPRSPARPEYRAWTRAVVAWAHRARPPVPFDLALAGAVAAGDLPPEAAAMPVQTLYRIARELGLAPRERRTRRLSADYPMQALLLDGSSSEHLVVGRALDDGDWLLRLHRRPARMRAGGYKNKPLGPDRMRVLVYGAWDMCTGYVISRYCVARGETAIDATDFLCWALARHDDPRVPFHGVPDDLWTDQGPLFKSGPALDLLERLDVALVTGEPYAKERMGGVERQHRTRWGRFERALWMRNEATLRLSALNERLREFEIAENGRRASRTPVAGRRATRTEAWVALTNARPTSNRLRALPDNPVATLARAAQRRIDRNGRVRWGGVAFEVEGDWCDRWVTVRQAVDGSGDLVVEDPATKERRAARRWTPRPYGEIRPAPRTLLDRLVDEAPADSGADIYAPRPDAAPNVVAIPTRAAPAAPLDNPLDAARCRDVEEAMRLFTSLWPHPLSAANRAEIVRRIEAAGLDRRAVVDLAQHLTREVVA